MNLLLARIALVVCCTATCSGLLRAADKPSILLIYADDAGFNDFSFQGAGEFKTPCIDRLAREGVVCTSGYMTGSVCVPSRAGMLTGRYQQRFGVYSNDFSLNIPHAEPNFGEAVQPLGYRTGVIGKWQIGTDKGYWPTERGFDYFFGFLAGHRDYFAYKRNSKKAKNTSFRLMENDGLINEFGKDFYTTDLFTEKAIAFMEESRQADEPFFLYLSHNAVHGPLQAKEDDKQPYVGLDDVKRRTLGGMIAALDRSTGRLLEYLESSALRENTLVVFTNDNGGSPATNADNAPLNGHKGTIYEGGNRVPFVFSWPGRLPEGVEYDRPIISLDLYPTFVQLAGTDPSTLERPLDGVDLMPYIGGQKKGAPHEALFWKMQDAAVRVGDWKLIRWDSRGGDCELFNLAEDIGEENNVLEDHPDVAQSLKTKLEAWEADNASDSRKKKKVTPTGSPTVLVQ
ncbi:Arylsulfatase precursor [Pirellulimonas nuda]|uniref:Arylsulfatase n=1 Tax=Pirellulimonas nuda TaxID=2528009 RepID=A0A518DH43_9BACT|nr:sulfatase-like hydrolase/transferase [Pirellulimonas nuda]QDU90801.1 Arylsulfatase precursor [Pirellulimonas nuda]